MAQRASPPLTTLCSRLAWSLQNGGVAVSLRAFSAMAIRGRVQTLGWQHGQRGAVAARGAEFKRSMPGGAAEEGGRRRREKQRKKESERKREKEEEDTKVVGATIGWRYQQEESQASKARQGKEGGGEGTREKGGGGGESAAPSSQNLRRRPLVENRIPIAPSGEKRYSCLKALRSNCLASPCETLCVQRCVKLECRLRMSSE